MRARWSAYAVGAVEYILCTTDPDGPLARADRERWAAQVAAFSASTRFEALEILERGEIVGDRAEVTFHARLSRAGDDVSFIERSVFVRRDGRWLYHRGETQNPHSNR